MIQTVIYSKQPGFAELCASALPECFPCLVLSAYEELSTILKNNSDFLILADCNSLSTDDELVTRYKKHRHRFFFFSQKIGAAFEEHIHSLPQIISSIENQNSSLEDYTDFEKQTLSSITGSSPVMKKLRRALWLASKSDSTVLLTGESGTGKSLCAVVIHALSRYGRNGKMMMTENVGAISPSLVESELFGAEKGAFTDALEGREGIIGSADGSTLLLDEIGELELSLQPKLLLAVQTGEIRKVGADTSRKVNLRWIFATNRNLQECIKQNLFRKDLFFRISEIRIEIPPLREHKEDIKEIAENYLMKFAEKRNCPPQLYPELSAMALKTLENYDWPGNVRQLQSVLKFAAERTKGKIITPDLFVSCLQDRPLL